MAKYKQRKIDYPAFLGYINELEINVYDMSQVNCQFSPVEAIGRGGFSVIHRGYLDDSCTPSLDTIPIALKVPLEAINEKFSDTKVSRVLHDVLEDIRIMRHF